MKNKCLYSILLCLLMVFFTLPAMATESVYGMNGSLTLPDLLPYDLAELGIDTQKFRDSFPSDLNVTFEAGKVSVQDNGYTDVSLTTSKYDGHYYLDLVDGYWQFADGEGASFDPASYAGKRIILYIGNDTRRLTYHYTDGVLTFLQLGEEHGNIAEIGKRFDAETSGGVEKFHYYTIILKSADYERVGSYNSEGKLTDYDVFKGKFRDYGARYDANDNLIDFTVAFRYTWTPSKGWLYGDDAPAGYEDMSVAKAMRLCPPQRTPSLPSTGVSGDADGDGTLSITDAMITLEHIADSSTLVSRSADVNADGEINIQDALLLLQHCAGWSITLK